MKLKYCLIGLSLFFIICLNMSQASSPYGKMDVYYNDILLPGSETAKPILKIGEPFKVSINLTVFQKSEASIMLSEIGQGNFVILNGSTKKLNTYESKIMVKNSSEVFEWTVTPTENWAGGSLPINLVYQINDFKTKDILVNSGFTIAYCTISNEYYEGKVPSTATSPSESLPDSNSTSSESIPAFTILAAVFALTLISFRR